METTFVIPNDVAQLHGAIDMLRQFCGEQNVPAEPARLMALALDEILVNIMRYAYEHGGEIHVRLEREDDRLAVEVQDRGRPFDPTKAEDPNLDQLADQYVESGRGIFLARQCVDELDYHYADGTNRVVLLKRLGP